MQLDQQSIVVVMVVVFASTLLMSAGLLLALRGSAAGRGAQADTAPDGGSRCSRRRGTASPRRSRCGRASGTMPFTGFANRAGRKTDKE